MWYDLSFLVAFACQKKIPHRSPTLQIAHPFGLEGEIEKDNADMSPTKSLCQTSSRK